MVCFGGPSLFQRKPRSNTHISGAAITVIHNRPVNMEERALHQHGRLSSMTSSNSRASSDTDYSARSFNPLHSHPPLHMNASPISEAKFVDMDEDSEDEHKVFQNLQHLKSTSEFSALSDDDLSSSSPTSSRRMTYVYDQNTQWPLKDWQTVLPGLVPAPSSSVEESEFVTPLRPRPANHQRRPTVVANEHDAFGKRGSWKRRGIIFNAETSSDDENSMQFDFSD